MNDDMKIDIVYLWVDDTDKKWRAQKDKWLEIIKGAKPVYADAACDARWRDNGEFLYSLRSVDQFAPWVNHIYIITGFGQVPKWLNTSHPKITIVPHEQIMPADAIPTFNATAIEMCIPNIPGLSEHFLLMNDDIFFNRPLTPEFFYDKHGRARVLYSNHSKRSKNIGQWMSRVDEYSQTLILSAKMIDIVCGKKVYKYRPSHGIDPYLKSSWIEFRNHPLITGLIDRQIRNKFRTNNEIQRWMFNLYDLAMGRAVFIHSRARKHTRHKIANAIYNTLFAFRIKNSPVCCTDTSVAYNALLGAPTFCINDSRDTDEKTLRANAEFMASRFPNKSSFEK
ncbi:MAG: Stealth CR1 domain-containing protein [Alphaproteobacteria bacterium]|nr:Stealth CR1 domain-containing protein [Alphaproteobacteria bacterium]